MMNRYVHEVHELTPLTVMGKGPANHTEMVAWIMRRRTQLLTTAENLLGLPASTETVEGAAALMAEYQSLSPEAINSL